MGLKLMENDRRNEMIVLLRLKSRALESKSENREKIVREKRGKSMTMLKHFM